MKLYNSIGPNPRLVRMFASVKGANLSLVDIDIVTGENREPGFLAINPTATTPVLELDSGQRIAETTAICEFLEERYPNPAMIGTSAEERAETRMWWRRVDLMIVQPMTTGFRGAEGHEMFMNRVPCFPEVAERYKQTVRDGFTWLEQQISGKRFICGDRVTVVDLLLLSFIEFGQQVGQSLPESCTSLHNWLETMRGREEISA